MELHRAFDETELYHETRAIFTELHRAFDETEPYHETRKITREISRSFMELFRRIADLQSIAIIRNSLLIPTGFYESLQRAIGATRMIAQQLSAKIGFARSCPFCGKNAKFLRNREQFVGKLGNWRGPN